jgi:predicted transcriptional regulator
MQPAPTEREMEILKVLWSIQEGSVRDVHSRLVEQSGLHFNTIQTQLRIMDEKGLVAHRRHGRTPIP